VTLIAFAQTDYAGGRRLILDAATMRRAVRRVARAVRKTDDITLANACTDYVVSCSHTVRRWAAKKQTISESNTGYQWTILAVLCRDYHMTVDQAWNTPYALARCLYDGASRAQGDDTLMTPRQQAMDEEIAAQLESQQQEQTA
jgi:hypothetical protein